MFTIRKSEERGHESYGWLDTRHTFSFGDYYDPRHLGFRALRVINDDRVKAGAGFPTHGHRDMEILTYVLEGAVQHKDSMGTGEVVRAGEVQRMTTGTGVTHSEYNPSATEALRFLQIWIIPERRGLPPSYEQRLFTQTEKRGRLRLIASRDGRDGSMTVHQDAAMYAAVLAPGERVRHELSEGRHAWVQVARGKVRVGNVELREGDGLSATEERALEIEGIEASEILVFDLS